MICCSFLPSDIKFQTVVYFNATSSIESVVQ